MLVDATAASRVRPSEGQPTSAMTTCLAGICALQLRDAHGEIVDRLLDGNAFPVRQQVHGDVVDVLDELRMLEPHVPRLRGAHRLLDRGANPIELARQLGDAQVVAQDHLVADDQADDVRMTVGDVDGGGELGLVGREVAVEPRAERDLELMAGGEFRDLPEALQRGIAAHRRDLAGEQAQVGVDLRRAGQDLRNRILPEAERRERHALHVIGPGRLGARPVQPGPQRERQRRENGCDDNAGGSHRDNVFTARRD